MFYICISAVLVDQHTTLEEVYIFFETAQYDQIERDVKVNTLILTSKDSAKLKWFPFNLNLSYYCLGKCDKVNSGFDR